MGRAYPQGLKPVENGPLPDCPRYIAFENLAVVSTLFECEPMEN